MPKTVEISDPSLLRLAIQQEVDQLVDDVMNMDYAEMIKHEILPYVQDEHVNRFDQGREPNGRLWKRLDRSTQRRKAFDLGVTKFKKLFRSGALRRSLFVIQPNNITNVSRQTPGARLTYGTSDPKARPHQSGTRHMPARPFIGVNNKMARKIGELISTGILKRLAK